MSDWPGFVVALVTLAAALYVTRWIVERALRDGTEPWRFGVSLALGLATGALFSGDRLSARSWPISISFALVGVAIGGYVGVLVGARVWGHRIGTRSAFWIGALGVIAWSGLR